MTPRKHIFTFIYLFLQWFFFLMYFHTCRLRISYVSESAIAREETMMKQN